MLSGVTGGGDGDDIVSGRRGRIGALPLSSFVGIAGTCILSGGTTFQLPLCASNAICALLSDADLDRFVVRMPRGPTCGRCGSGRCGWVKADGGVYADVAGVVVVHALVDEDAVLPGVGGGGRGRIPMSTRSDGRLA